MIAVSRSSVTLRLVGASLTVLAFDATSKALAESKLSTAAQVIPGLEFDVSYNTGIAFGALAGLPPTVVLAAVGAVALAAAVLIARGSLPIGPLAGGLVLGGALANLVDRAGDGRVTDFIDPARWPAFNLADVAITAGVVLAVAALLKHPEASGHSEMRHTTR